LRELFPFELDTVLLDLGAEFEASPLVLGVELEPPPFHLGLGTVRFRKPAEERGLGLDQRRQRLIQAAVTVRCRALLRDGLLPAR
jgi:hypothetical protein